LQAAIPIGHGHKRSPSYQFYHWATLSISRSGSSSSVKERCTYWSPVRHFQTSSRSLEQQPSLSQIRTIPYSSLTVGVPREIFPNERRVSLTPQNAALLIKKGFANVLVECNAGKEAQFLDEHYAAAGAQLVSREEVFQSSDIMLKVRPPLYGQETEHVKKGSTVISFLYPTQNKMIVESLAARNVNVFAVCAPEHRWMPIISNLVFRWI
jgi:Alanine dehydrogenase/PNT, N-terminal domain